MESSFWSSLQPYTVWPLLSVKEQGRLHSLVFNSGLRQNDCLGLGILQPLVLRAFLFNGILPPKTTLLSRSLSHVLTGIEPEGILH